MINVLVFPCGSEIGLEVNRALKFDKHIKLFGLSSVPCHGSLVYDNYYEGIPHISAPDFIDRLNDYIAELKIDILIPAYDDVILFLAHNADKINCTLATSSPETCDIARSKLKTYELFSEEPFVPDLYNIEDVSEDDLPLFGKPDIGQGSQGVVRIDDLSDLESIRRSEGDYVISELLPGEEYTIDCFTDSNGELLIASMRERRRIKMGISVNSVSVEPPEEIMKIASVINDRLEFDGVWFFQVKRAADGRFKLLELAPRVAGTMATSRIRGFNFILNTVYQKSGIKVAPIPNMLEKVEIDRALSNVYALDIDYEYVYIDFDDTIAADGIVNLPVISFIYQCRNNNKKIILLTRHNKDIYDTLKKYCIDPELFYEIIHFEEGNKSCFIKHSDSIFIDDSFRERADVSENCGIPVFDLDQIEALIDWRKF